MSAEATRYAKPALLVIALGFAGAVAAEPAEPEPPPDPALLEYLGSWDESDEEWLLVADGQDDESGNESDDRDDASQERDDEN